MPSITAGAPANERTPDSVWPADSPCNVIEKAMQQLVSNGATADDVNASWSRFSNDTTLGAAVAASLTDRTN